MENVQMTISQRLKAQLLAVELAAERAKAASMLQKAQAIEELVGQMLVMMDYQCRAIAASGKRVDEMRGKNESE